MASDADAHRPFTLWLETLPSSDTARLRIQQRSEQVHVVLYWNQEVHSERRFTTLEAAETWGYELLCAFQDDALAGVLLGYDRDVLARLQAQCSLT